MEFEEHEFDRINEKYKLYYKNCISRGDNETAMLWLAVCARLIEAKHYASEAATLHIAFIVNEAKKR